MRIFRSRRVLASVAILFVAFLGACRLKTLGSQPGAEAMAPAALLESTLGPLRSQDALSRGALVLVFYRGHW